jgi:hypothetical protein
MSHTTGPCKYRTHVVPSHGYYIESINDDSFIGEVGGGTMPETEIEDNAKLIAAAPDLLAACKEFVRKCECGEARSKRSYAQMKAAIDLTL